MINFLMSLLTIFSLVGIGYALSSSRKDINWKTVAIGIAGQFAIILFTLKVPLGQKLLEVISIGFQNVINLGLEGVTFVFGDLTSKYYIFAISVLSMIVFTSALTSVLYFLKVIPFVVNTLGAIISKIMKVSKVEAMCTVSNSFLGGNESLMVIQPYVSKLTRSEFFACAAGGFSSASAAILASYANLLGGDSMKYLLIAVFTVPFASLMFSKLLSPETEVSQIDNVKAVESNDKNIFEAICNGATNGFHIATGVGASLIAFVGLTAVLNALLSIFGLNLNQILSWVFYPFAYLLNIPTSEIANFTQILGAKTGVNEFVAFTQMSQVLNTLSPRTIAILTVGVCNFCNFSVIAILTSTIKVVCPERATEMSSIGLKTLLTGLLATLSTASIVAMLF